MDKIWSKLVLQRIINGGRLLGREVKTKAGLSVPECAQRCAFQSGEAVVELTEV